MDARSTQYHSKIVAAVGFKMRGFVEFTALHAFYVTGIDWVMPKLLSP
jgi:hypothetical protein